MPTEPKSRMPRWAVIGLIVGGVILVGGFVAAAVWGFGQAAGSIVTELEEDFDEWESAASADIACTAASAALSEPLTGEPDPVRAVFIARDLTYAADSADSVVSDEPQYVTLTRALDGAADAANEVAELPADSSTWTSAQRAAGEAAWAELGQSRVAVAEACRDIPVTDDYGDPIDSF